MLRDLFTQTFINKAGVEPGHIPLQILKNPKQLAKIREWANLKEGERLTREHVNAYDDQRKKKKGTGKSSSQPKKKSGRSKKKMNQ